MKFIISCTQYKARSYPKTLVSSWAVFRRNDRLVYDAKETVILHTAIYNASVLMLEIDYGVL